MNDLAKKLLGRCSGIATPRTPEQIEEARLIRHRAELVADRAYQRWEESQAVQIQQLLSTGRTYSG